MFSTLSHARERGAPVERVRCWSPIDNSFRPIILAPEKPHKTHHHHTTTCFPLPKQPTPTISANNFSCRMDLYSAVVLNLVQRYESRDHGEKINKNKKICNFSCVRCKAGQTALHHHHHPTFSLFILWNLTAICLCASLSSFSHLPRPRTEPEQQNKKEERKKNNLRLLWVSSAGRPPLPLHWRKKKRNVGHASPPGRPVHVSFSPLATMDTAQHSTFSFFLSFLQHFFFSSSSSPLRLFNTTHTHTPDTHSFFSSKDIYFSSLLLLPPLFFLFSFFLTNFWLFYLLVDISSVITDQIFSSAKENEEKVKGRRRKRRRKRRREYSVWRENSSNRSQKISIERTKPLARAAVPVAVPMQISLNWRREAGGEKQKKR